jgi:hypothetical protein
MLDFRSSGGFILRGSVSGSSHMFAIDLGEQLMVVTILTAMRAWLFLGFYDIGDFFYNHGRSSKFLLYFANHSVIIAMMTEWLAKYRTIIEQKARSERIERTVSEIGKSH